MKFYLLILNGIFLIALSSCLKKPEIADQLTIPNVTRSPTPEIGVILVTATFPIDRIEEKVTPFTEAAPTNTVAPTPFIYVVESGDTLFDIAALHNTTIETILELNPGLQPELISIGQELILPEQVRPDLTPLSNMLELSAIVVDGLSLYKTPNNGIWLLGEVLNQGENDLENVQVVVSILDDSDQTVYEDQLWTATNIIPSGSKSPFGTLVLPAPLGDVSPNAAVLSADPMVNLENRYLDFEVTDTKATIEGARSTIRGSVVNVGELNASEVALIVTLYDEEGNVSGYHKSYLDEPLAAGSSAPFEIKVLPPGRIVHDYAILALGLVDLNLNSE